MAAKPWRAPPCQPAIQLLGPLCGTLLRAGFGLEGLPQGRLVLTEWVCVCGGEDADLRKASGGSWPRLQPPLFLLTPSILFLSAVINIGLH